MVFEYINPENFPKFQSSQNYFASQSSGKSCNKNNKCDSALRRKNYLCNSFLFCRIDFQNVQEFKSASRYSLSNNISKMKNKSR